MGQYNNASKKETRIHTGYHNVLAFSHISSIQNTCFSELVNENILGL